METLNKILIRLPCFWTLSIIQFLFKQQRFGDGFCLRPQVEPTQLGPIFIAIPITEKVDVVRILQ
jgi:hypothetical protein